MIVITDFAVLSVFYTECKKRVAHTMLCTFLTFNVNVIECEKRLKKKSFLKFIVYSMSTIISLKALQSDYVLLQTNVGRLQTSFLCRLLPLCIGMYA